MSFDILVMFVPYVFLTISSHRPLDLDNIYNQDQVKLLMKEGEHLSVPDFDDIYADSEVSSLKKAWLKLKNLTLAF